MSRQPSVYILPTDSERSSRGRSMRTVEPLRFLDSGSDLRHVLMFQ